MITHNCVYTPGRQNKRSNSHIIYFQNIHVIYFTKTGHLSQSTLFHLDPNMSCTCIIRSIHCIKKNKKTLNYSATKAKISIYLKV